LKKLRNWKSNRPEATSFRRREDGAGSLNSLEQEAEASADSSSSPEIALAQATAEAIKQSR